MRFVVLTVLGLALLATPDLPRAEAMRPKIGHVFVIVLENTGYARTFGDSTEAPYLADTLARRGLLLRRYYGTAHNSLPNYIAMISGITPTPETQADCPVFSEFVATGRGRDGQPIGRGCVYPASVRTVGDQLDAKGLRWRAYMEDMGNDPRREPARCAHPIIGQVDSTSRATPADQYATKHNPFMYFHSIIDDRARCARAVVPLSLLEADLVSGIDAPRFSFIVPNLCNDGHDWTCASGEVGGLAAADAFLQRLVPSILASPAFSDDGLLIITFDEAMPPDAAACCGPRSGPNTTSAGGDGPGGGRVGAVVLSPAISGGRTSDVPYDHYSLLRTVEDIFGLAHLGYAGRADVKAIDLRR
ncbi:MAG TPA: alkaline phosphatase family protein [Gemmatimonadaceae bacterium]